MTGRKLLFALTIGVLMGTFAGAVIAEAKGMDVYGPADPSVSNDIGTGETQVDAWDLREAMETGALPGRQGDSSDAVCCRGIDEPTIESGGQLFRPEVDAGP